MQLRSRLGAAMVGLTVAGAAVAAAVLGPAGPAVGQSSPSIQAQVQVNSPATLVAKGAGVDVSVTASCSGTTAPGFLVVELVENVKGNIAYGFGEASPSCTGASQTFEVLVTAGSDGPSGIPGGPSAAFAKGVAIADTSFGACSPDGLTCATQNIEPTIKIRK
jgi:hypothetical protein